MKADLRQRVINNGFNLTLKCPHCGNIGTFETIFEDIYCNNDNGKPIVIGIKKCPNPNCGGHAFVIYDQGSRSILDSYPITKLDFNKDDIPTQIAETFEEAIICHANKCYIASAIMVRKTLEQLCKDKGAEGRNLKERIQALDGYYKRFVNNKNGKNIKKYEDQICVLLKQFSDVVAVRKCKIDPKVLSATRHKYSHLYPDEETSLALDRDDLYWLTEKCKILLTCCILNMLGLTNKEINLCCNNSPISQIIDSFPLELK